MRNSIPLPRTTFHAPHLFHRRAKLLTLIAICAAGLPYPVFAQWSTGSGGTIYYNGGNVGIGTAGPAGKLHVASGSFRPATGVAGGLVLDGPWGAGLIFKDTAYAGIWTNDYGQSLNFGTNGSTSGFGSDYGQMILKNGNVGIGTANPQHLLHVAGTIGAEEVIVSSTGADYVFNPDYHLTPLPEVARYINENHHLPGIPSSPEVKEKGVNLGEMQAKLLAKIEELTLHMIQEEKENQDLKRRIARLEASVGTAVLKDAK